MLIELFEPGLPPLEIFIRGSLTYLGLFALLRFLRREAGQVGISDVLLVVLLADAAQNAMSAEYKSLTDGFILVVTLAFWDYFLDFLGYHSLFFERLLRPAPLPLIKNGKIIRKNMRQEMISDEELQSALRKNGIQELEKVKICFLEGDGEFSIIKR